ncbi:hypothetical protein HKD37_14G040097 [Glycine soja]
MERNFLNRSYPPMGGRFRNSGDLLQRLKGEVTITLNDVAFLLHLLITSAFHSFKALHVDEVMLLLVELLEMKPELKQYSVMEHMYDYHGYETFVVANHCPSIAEAITTKDYHERKPRDHHAVKDFELISCFSGHIRWGLVVVIHQPERVVWQFGYVQTIPPHSPGSRLCLEDIDDRWMHFFEYLTLVGQICVVPRQCALDYINWFYMISHPFMRSAQPEDPSRHSSILQDDTYYPVVAASMEEAPAHAASHVEQPRHVFQAIVERLERLLNLRIVIEGKKTYDVLEDYLRIARSVIVDHNVYVQSRRRQHMEDA